MIEVEYYHVGITVLEESFHQFINRLQGQHRYNLLHHLIIVIQAGDRLLVQIVINILIDKLAVVALLLVRILLFQLTHVVRLVALILCGSEAKLSSTASLDIGSLQGSLCLTFLREYAHLEGILGLRQQILIVAYASLQVRTVGLLG